MINITSVSMIHLNWIKKKKRGTPFQQWLDPARHTLTVAVKEGENVSCSVGGTNEPGPYQTFSFFGANETNALQVTDILSQL